jgi:geranylgeranyl pyrophosphate synthase
MNTFTLPVIHLLSTADSSNRSTLAEILSSPDQTQESRIALLTQYGCLGYAYASAAEFRRRAIDAIADLEESIAKMVIIETADFCVKRVG